MLGNLQGVAQKTGDKEALLRELGSDRRHRPRGDSRSWPAPLLRFQTGRRDAAIADLDWFLEHAPKGSISTWSTRCARRFFESESLSFQYTSEAISSSVVAI